MSYMRITEFTGHPKEREGEYAANRSYPFQSDDETRLFAVMA